MKGIILAGGTGTRLYPLTKVMTKQLQPIYDKPMIYYPLSLLMLCGIKEILIISTEQDLPNFKNLLGDGRHLGVKFDYVVQDSPRGIADAFILGEEFLSGSPSMLILGDNLFYGDYSPFRQAIKKQVSDFKEKKSSAHVFAYAVSDPGRYGVVEFDSETRRVLSIEEKPKKPKSSYAIPGLYLFDETVSQRARHQAPSPRGELEITDLMATYLNEGTLKVETINRGMAWLDTGTPKSLLEAWSFIAALEERQGLKVACLEEIALRMNFIDKNGLTQIIESIPKGPYQHYLINVLQEARSGQEVRDAIF